MNVRTSAFDNNMFDDAHDDPTPSRFSVDGIMRSLRSVATLSEALRILGAGIILVSMSVFLLQGWSEGNDIQRYLLLLTQTGLLGAAGFAMSHLVRETKGARLFFGLALISVPANFTILGALLYSVIQWDGGLATYPGYAHWRLDDLANIGVTMSAAMLVLVPVALFCYAVMARHSAKLLSAHFLLLNALLLLPIRSSFAAGSIALAGVIYALIAVGKLTRKDLALKTPEGRFALATLFIPLGIILFRSMYFYAVDSLMVAMVGSVLFLTARQMSQFPDRSKRVAAGLEFLSWPVAFVVAFALADALVPNGSAGLAASVFSIAYAAFALDIAKRTESSRLEQIISGSVSVIVAASFTLAVMVDAGGLSAISTLFAGMLLLLWGAAGRKPLTVTAGLITLGAGAFFGLDSIVTMLVTSSWIELALFGAGAIALGSVLDRHGVAMKLRLSRWYRGTDKTEIALEG